MSREQSPSQTRWATAQLQCPHQRRRGRRQALCTLPCYGAGTGKRDRERGSSWWEKTQRGLKAKQSKETTPRVGTASLAAWIYAKSLC